MVNLIKMINMILCIYLSKELGYMAGSKKMNEGEFATTREAAASLGVSLRTIQLWVESGVLTAWKTAGGHRRIPRTAINKLLQQQQAELNSEASSKTFKILIVEDEKELLGMYEVHINSWGLNCQVFTAKDGYDGLLEIGQHKPDLVISDLLMPGMDGFRMIHSLKEREETKDTQLVVVTVLDNEEIEEQGGLPSDVLILQKPIPFDVIKGLVMGGVSSKQFREQ